MSGLKCKANLSKAFHGCVQSEWTTALCMRAVQVAQLLQKIVPEVLQGQTPYPFLPPSLNSPQIVTSMLPLLLLYSAVQGIWLVPA